MSTTDVPESESEDRLEGDRYRLLGARLLELRRMRGVPLKTVADAVGVSASFLSMVERGQTDLSLSRFSRLTEYYNIAPSELLLELTAAYRAPEIGELTEARSYLRGVGVEFRVLQDNPQVIYTRLEPRTRFDEPSAHRGNDLWVTVSGRARLHYGQSTFDLEEGQTARFSSTIPHAISNPFEKSAVLMAVCNVPYW